jgi:hypothetical protein
MRATETLTGFGFEGTPNERCILMVTVFAVSGIGWALMVVVFLAIWISLAFWPARVAGRKGHSFIGYFILSLVFFPLALITAYVVDDRAALAH